MPDFTYNASALGGGGVIERGNVTYSIPSVASVALAPTGGEGRTVASNYYSEELSFSHAETRVFGRETSRETFTTSTYVQLKDVNVLNKLMIGEMHAVVTSTRGFDGGGDHEFEIDAHYDGVRIGRHKVFPRIDIRLKQVRTYEELGQFLRGRTAAGIAPSDPQGLAKRFNANSTDELAKLIDQKKPVQGSLVEHVEGLEKKPVGPTIFVPGLGYVRFAELLYKPGRRRLNLIRIMFGPQKDETEAPRAFMMMAEESSPDDGGPTGGSMTLGSGEGNGAPVEP